MAQEFTLRTDASEQIVGATHLIGRLQHMRRQIPEGNTAEMCGESFQ